MSSTLPFSPDPDRMAAVTLQNLSHRHRRRRSTLIVVSCLAPLLIVLGVIGGPLFGFLAVVLILVLSFAWLAVLRTPARIREQYELPAESPYLLPMVVHFEPEGLRTEREGEEASVPWTDILEWYGHDQEYQLFVSDTEFLLLPYEAFKSDEDRAELEGYLRRAANSPESAMA